jgi:CNT family concentrative nucleoside transporter
VFVFVMADIARGHNGSAQVGVVPNPDPALDIAHEHKHEHFHHSANAEKGQLPGHDVVYTSGTTADRSVIPSEVHPDDAVHRRKLDEKHAVHDIEKTGGYDSNEGSLERGSNHPRSSDSDIPERRGKYSVYIHLFIAMLFTG